MYIAWTDGSFKPSKNRGGYSSIIIENDKIIAKLYQGYENTTNNRQELMGVLETLRFFKTPVDLLIYSDSQYVVNTINDKHVWKWFKEKDLSKKNLDLWSEIVDLLNFHNVKFEWVKGHNKNKWNEMADLYATHASDCINPIKDRSYENS